MPLSYRRARSCGVYSKADERLLYPRDKNAPLCILSAGSHRLEARDVVQFFRAGHSARVSAVRDPKVRALGPCSVEFELLCRIGWGPARCCCTKDQVKRSSLPG